VRRNSIGQPGSNLIENVRNMGEVSAGISSFARCLHGELSAEERNLPRGPVISACPDLRCLLFGVDRKIVGRGRTDANDPQRKFSLPLNHSDSVRDLFVSYSETLLSQVQ